MRSPPGARFPSPHALRLIACAAAALVGCPQDTTPPAGEPTPSVSPAPTDETAEARGGSDQSREEIRTVVIRDRDSKRTVRGTAPGYAEIETASVETSATQLVFEVRLAGRIPDQMPDRQSVLRVTFTVTTKAGHRYAFEAQCVRPGWGAYASGGPDDAPIPEVAIRGKTLELAVDPAYMGGLQPFDWLVNVAWTSGEANYAFDAAPTKGVAGYP